MFANFSFATASRHPSALPPSDDDDIYVPRRCSISSRSVSPFDTRTSRFSVSHLTQQLSEQCLHSDSTTGRSPDYSYEDTAYTTSSTSNSPQFPLHIPTAPRRSRDGRRNAISLCDAAHLRSIASLMERMIDLGDQCAVSPPPRITSNECRSTSPNDDEGYDSLEDGSPISRQSTNQSITYRRSRDTSLTGACVAKTVRQRKAKRRSTGEKNN